MNNYVKLAILILISLSLIIIVSNEIIGRSYSIEPTIIEFSQNNTSNEEVFYEVSQNEDQKYENNNETNYILNIWVIIVLSTLIIPLATYIKYGNSNFKYKPYETKNPIHYSPAIINSLFGKGFRKKVGENNTDGYQATILDLINKNYLKMNFVESDEGNLINKNEKPQKKIILSINRKLLQSHKTQIEEYEKNVIKSLATIEKNKIIDFDNAEEMLNKRTRAKIFQKNYYEWNENLREHTNKILDKYYNGKCSVILRFYGFLAILLGLITIILLTFSVNIVTLLVGLSMLILGLLLEIIPDKKLGGWNKEGKILKSKWNSFEKYFKEKSMAKNHFPQDSSRLNEYLTYVVALGMSKNVNKTFKNFSSEILSYISLYPYFKYSSYNIINQTVDHGLFRDSTYSAYYHAEAENYRDIVKIPYRGGDIWWWYK